MAFRCGLDLHWHALDNGLPDGDESGHLGAIELYRGIMDDRGLLEAVRTSYLSPSEYPPLFALVNGALLSLLHVDGPFPRGVPALLCFWTGLSWLAVAWMTAAAGGYAWGRARRGCGRGLRGTGTRVAGRPSMTWAGVLAAAVYSTSPLTAGLGRHAMIEPFLALWVSVSLALAFSTRQFTRTLPTLLLGIAVTFGFLTKQTFLLYVAGPLALMVLDGLIAFPRRTVGRVALLAAIAIPLPLTWTWLHWEQQAAYSMASALAKAQVGLGYHAAYYLAVLAGLGLGAAWVLPSLIGVGTLVRHKRWQIVAMLLLVLGTLTLVPKKYPRLIVPAMPLVAGVTAIGLACVNPVGWKRVAAGAACLAGALQQAVVTLPIGAIPPRAGVWRPAFFDRVDPGCPQLWIEAPRRDDLGFQDVLAVALHTPGRRASTPWIGMVDEPSIPCSYETTFHYAYHLHQYLRRHGVPADVIPVYARDPERFLASAGAFQLLIGTSPWCVEGKHAAHAEDWVPPRLEWHAARLQKTSGSPGARGGTAAAEKGDAAGVGEATPANRSPDERSAPREGLCDLRPSFALETRFSYPNPSLPFQLFVYRRVSGDAPAR